MRTLVFQVTIHGLPPSDNELYMTKGRFGTRVLTPIGKAYKNRIHEIIKNAWVAAGMPPISRLQMLELDEYVRIPHVFTKTETAKYPYVIVDARNRGKAIEDEFHQCFGLDDSQQFHVHYHKIEGPGGVHLMLYETDEVAWWPGSEPPAETTIDD